MTEDERHAYSRVEEELMPGEELLWVGRPASRWRGPAGGAGWLSITAVIGFLVALGIILGFFPLARGMAMAPTMFFSPMWMPMILIFLLMLVMVAVNPLSRMLNTLRTTYAITNRRILILDGILATKVTSYGPDDIERIERRSYSGGRGDIIFRYEPRAYRARRGNWWQTQYTSEPIGFFGIPDVRDVERLLIETFMTNGEVYAKPKRKHDALDDLTDPLYNEGEVDLSDLLPAQDPDELVDSSRE
ncbi:MAG: hypothetical protein HPY64_16195 [Anaerolineae bacterium]|nr:hypothetical protein [Anaerolineae bacterium]